MICRQGHHTGPRSREYRARAQRERVRGCRDHKRCTDFTRHIQHHRTDIAGTAALTTASVKPPGPTKWLSKEHVQTELHGCGDILDPASSRSMLAAAAIHAPTASTIVVSAPSAPPQPAGLSHRDRTGSTPQDCPTPTPLRERTRADAGIHVAPRRRNAGLRRGRAHCSGLLRRLSGSGRDSAPGRRHRRHTETSRMRFADRSSRARHGGLAVTVGLADPRAIQPALAMQVVHGGHDGRISDPRFAARSSNLADVTASSLAAQAGPSTASRSPKPRCCTGLTQRHRRFTAAALSRRPCRQGVSAALAAQGAA